MNRDRSQAHGSGVVGRVELIVLLALVAAGAWVRLIHLDALPWGSADGEDGTGWFAVAGQLAHWHPLLPSGLVFWKGWPYTLLCSMVAAIFGLSKWSMRLPSALSGIAAIPLTWWLSRRVLRAFEFEAWLITPLSLLAAYIIAFSQWWILLSRAARFYSLGAALYLAALAAILTAMEGRAEGGWPESGAKRERALALFGVMSVLAVATFHAGGLALFAVPALVLLAVPLSRREWGILAATLLAAGLWYMCVLFFWKTGHVTSESGAGDLGDLMGGRFVRHSLSLVVIGLGAWAVIVRDRISGLWRGLAAGLLTVLVATLAIAPFVRQVTQGSLRVFDTLSADHFWLMILASLGLVLVPLLALRMAREGRWAAALFWILIIVPAGIVGADTGHYASRYLLFVFAPLAVAAVVAIATVSSMFPGMASRAALAVAIGLTVIAIHPSIGPAAALEMTRIGPGDPMPATLSGTTHRDVAFDIEGATRYVAAARTAGDAVVGTQCCISAAFLGRLDYLYTDPRPDLFFLDPEGVRRNLVDGGLLLTDFPQLLELASARRVFVIVDGFANPDSTNGLLRKELVDMIGAPAFVAAQDTAEVFVMGPTGRSSAAPEVHP